jgi:sensor histidine kinase regulating citrate/malate metabolism
MQRNVYKEKKQITEKYLNEQKNHYEYLDNREKETKKFRHDLRNHMQMLSNFARNHQYDDFEKYLETIEMKIESFGNIITVHNGIVDAVINQFYSKAIQDNIKMEVSGRFPEDCAIDAYDLCTIFSNVLSNALEAAIKTDEKLVTVECRYTDKNIIVVVTNSFINDGNETIKTRKDDLDYHGYGLENTKDSIEKYHGVFDIETKDNLFILKILFNYIEKRDYENRNN